MPDLNDRPNQTDAQETAKAAKPGTEYVVLTAQAVTEEGAAPSYTLAGTVTAANDIAAINAALGENPTAGDYVAVPARSFRMRAVSVATVTQTKVA